MRRSITLAVVSLALLLVIPGAIFVPPARTASAQAPHYVYLPWVSNSGTTNGIGPWFGKVSIQNVDEFPCAVSIWVGGANGWTRNAQLSLRGNASLTISAQSLAVPRPGAPVQLEALCPVVASVKEVSPDNRSAAWSDGARIVTGYTGIAQSDLDVAMQGSDSGWFLPIVQTNSDWNTLIRVSNMHGTDDVTAEVQLYPSGNQLGAAGVSRTLEVMIPPGGHVAVNALNELGVHGWVGYASITADGPVGVVAHRSKSSTDMAISNVAVAADRTSGGIATVAPLLFSAYNSWNTGINVANVADREANVTVRYFESGAGFVREETLTLAARSMEYIYTPGNVPQDGFVGSAIIESDTPLVAAIDEVKYPTTEAMSYLASPIAQTSAAIPITFREDPGNRRHDNSGINIANLNPNAEQTVEVTFFTGTGDPILPAPVVVTIPAGSSDFVYLPFVDDFPPGTVASAQLRSNDPLGFVAVSNNVNYAVPGDGSVVFAAMSDAGLYRLSTDSE